MEEVTRQEEDIQEEREEREVKKWKQEQKKKKREIIEKLVLDLMLKGGFTIVKRNADFEEFKKLDGYIVSITSFDCLTFDDVKKVLSIAYDLLQEDTLLGGWYDAGKRGFNLTVDLNIWVEDKNEAVKLGFRCKQKAIWDIKSGCEIYI